MNEQKDIIDLQTRVAYQEDFLTELNQIVTKQDAEILTLKLQVKRLAQRIEDILTASNAQQVDISDERPPHY